MKSKRTPKKNAGISRSARMTNVNQLSASSDFYVATLNALIVTLFGADAFILGRLEELPLLVRAYDHLSQYYLKQGDSNGYIKAHQVACLYKKLELPLFKETSKQEALGKWLQVEEECKEMNRLCWDITQRPLTHEHSDLGNAIEAVRSEIRQILPDMPPDLPQVAPFMRFGPGASTTHRFDEGCSACKVIAPSAYIGMEEEVDWLYANMAFKTTLHAAITEEIPLAVVEPKYVDHAVIEFVPKSIAEMRTIEVGPSLATFVQAGYDGFIRQNLLHRWGLDLQNQEPNKSLAYRGSIMGPVQDSPCTIDLSSASDRISYGLVALLLPRQWTLTMSRYRAKQVRLPDGTFHVLEKFSSMGNSLTFSLQTLIFAAVVRSVLRERGCTGQKWRVYGDDIIVPYNVYHDVVERLTLFGFRVNPLKSFAEGFFRESCGADYLHGMDVRAFYVKRPLGCLSERFKVLNLIQIQARKVPILAHGYESLYRMILSSIPSSRRLFGEPFRSPDSCIWIPHRLNRGKVLAPVNSEIRVPESIGYAVSLLNGYRPGLPAYRPKSLLLFGDWLRADTGIAHPKGSLGIPQEWDARPHEPPSIPVRGRWEIRRGPRRAAGQCYIAHEDLRFDPLVMRP